MNYYQHVRHLPNLSIISCARPSSTEKFSITRHRLLNGLSLSSLTIFPRTAHKSLCDFWVGVSPRVPVKSFTNSQLIRFFPSNSPANRSTNPWMVALTRGKNSVKTRWDKSAACLPKSALEQACLRDSTLSVATLLALTCYLGRARVGLYIARQQQESQQQNRNGEPNGPPSRQRYLMTSLVRWGRAALDGVKCAYTDPPLMHVDHWRRQRMSPPVVKRIFKTYKQLNLTISSCGRNQADSP